MSSHDNDENDWVDVTEVEAAQEAVDAAEEALKLAREDLKRAQQEESKQQEHQGSHKQLILARWQANPDELQKIDFREWTRSQIEHYFKVLKDFYEQQIRKSSENLHKEEGGPSIYRQWMLGADPTNFRDRLYRHIYKHLQEIHRLLQYTGLLKPFGH